MCSLRIKRRYTPDLDAKAALRTYVDQLPLDQQRAFVLIASALINARDNRQPALPGSHQQYAELELQR